MGSVTETNDVSPLALCNKCRSILTQAEVDDDTGLCHNCLHDDEDEGRQLLSRDRSLRIGARDPDNLDRSDWARAALERFATITGPGELEADPDSCLSDLLCDLHHWADREGIDWKEATERAGRNYEYEVHFDG